MLAAYEKTQAHPDAVEHARAEHACLGPSWAYASRPATAAITRRQEDESDPIQARGASDTVSSSRIGGSPGCQIPGWMSALSPALANATQPEHRSGPENAAGSEFDDPRRRYQAALPGRLHGG